MRAKVRPQRHGTAEIGDCFAAASEPRGASNRPRTARFEARLSLIEGLQQRQRHIEGVESELGPNEQLPRHRLARHHPEYLLGLLGRQKRSAVEQPRCVRQCRLERTERIWPLIHRFTAAFRIRQAHCPVRNWVHRRVIKRFTSGGCIVSIAIVARVFASG